MKSQLSLMPNLLPQEVREQDLGNEQAPRWFVLSGKIGRLVSCLRAWALLGSVVLLLGALGSPFSSSQLHATSLCPGPQW